MAITYNTGGGTNATSASSISVAINHTANNNTCLVGYSWHRDLYNNDTITNVTWNSGAMTLLANNDPASDADGADKYAQMRTLVAPTTGNLNLASAHSSTEDVLGIWGGFYDGVDQTTPTGGSDNGSNNGSNTLDVTCSNAAGETLVMCSGAFRHAGNFTAVAPNGGATERFEDIWFGNDAMTHASDIIGATAADSIGFTITNSGNAALCLAIIAHLIEGVTDPVLTQARFRGYYEKTA